MGKRKDLSAIKIGEISGMLRAKNHTQREIARICHVSQTSVWTISQKMQSEANLTSKRKGRCGRHRITTKRDDRKIRNIVCENRKLPVNAITNLVNDANIKVSRRTVRRRMREENLLGRKPARKPKLTPAMIKKRYEWAKKYKNFTIDDWKKVILYCFMCYPQFYNMRLPNIHHL